jgi:hypothetical protein
MFNRFSGKAEKDIIWGRRIRELCSKYFNKINLDQKNFVNSDLFYIYKVLQKKLIIFNPVFRMISNKEEKKVSLNIVSIKHMIIFSKKNYY